jgi:hypothetical protein
MPPNVSTLKVGQSNMLQGVLEERSQSAEKGITCKAQLSRCSVDLLTSVVVDVIHAKLRNVPHIGTLNVYLVRL